MTQTVGNDDDDDDDDDEVELDTVDLQSVDSRHLGCCIVSRAGRHAEL